MRVAFKLQMLPPSTENPISALKVLKDMDIIKGVESMVIVLTLDQREDLRQKRGGQ